MKNNHKKHSGFTLVEIIISFALFAILMTPIYSIIISTMNNNKNGAVKQTAALHGQEILEGIKSGDIVTDKDKNGNIIGISKIGSLNLDSDGTILLGEGYQAKVTINRNISMNMDKQLISDKNDESEDENQSKDSVETIDFKVNLSGTDSPIKVQVGNKEGKLNYDTNADEALKVVINTKTMEDKKIIVIKDKNNNDILTDELEIKAEEKDKQIKLNLNFDDYKALSKADSTKLKKVEVVVYNQDDIPLNLCLQKSINLDVKINNKLGIVRTYDNRSNDTSKLGELYDVDIEVTQKQNNQIKTVFTGETSQNIK